mgnify:FL=1
MPEHVWYSPKNYYQCLCDFWDWPTDQCRFPEAFAKGYCKESQLEFHRLGPPVEPPAIITVAEERRQQHEIAQAILGFLHDDAVDRLKPSLKEKPDYEDKRPIVIKSRPSPKRKTGWAHGK